MQPQAEVLQGPLRRHACRQPAKVMGPLPVHAQGVREVLLHGFHALAYPSHPAPEPLGPRRPPLTLGWAEALGARGPPPGLLGGLSLHALRNPVWPRSRGAHARQARVGLATPGNARLGAGRRFGAGRPHAAARAHPHGGERQQPRDACIPAQPVAPAPRGSARPPPRATALGLPRGEAGAVQRFRRTLLGCHPLHPRQKTRAQGLRLLAYGAVALLPRRQRGEGGAPMALGRALPAACTAKAWPLAKEGVSELLIPCPPARPNSCRLMQSPRTRSYLCCVWEKPMVRRTHRVLRGRTLMGVLALCWGVACPTGCGLSWSTRNGH